MKTYTKGIFLILSFLFWDNIMAASLTDFNQSFSDSTLRVDYIFAKSQDGCGIYLSEQSRQKGWAGRRTRLNETPYKGNGTILITNPETGDTLYINSFSTLFQEWLSTPEAETSAMSFENSFLLPLPRQKSEIIVALRNNRNDEIAKETHIYDPADILVRSVGKNPEDYQYIHRGGDPEKVIDVAILAEGYTEDEMDKFIVSAQKITDEILSYKPFSDNKDRFNFVAVKSPSRESGVSIPYKDIWKDTAFDSHFSTFYSNRYLTSPSIFKMHKALEGIPYEHIIILTNTPEYGGGGIYNSYLMTVADNQFSLPVAVHEFGHSFGGLADEYFYENEQEEMYPEDIEPWEPNITTLVDFDSKWKNQIDESTAIPTPWDKSKRPDQSLSPDNIKVGVYEGAGYKTHGVYRPAITCRMRDNYFPTFCPVCEISLSELIQFYTE